LVVNFNTDPALYKRMLGIVHDELAKIANQGPNPEDISKVKLNLLKQQAENKQENAWWMQTISEYDRDGIDNLTGMEARIEALDGPSIQALAKRFIENNNVREIMLMPAP
jgi:zinc protease